MPTSNQRENSSRSLRSLLQQCWALIRDYFRSPRSQPIAAADSSASVVPLEPLRRLQLTDGVSRTLFEEYARHRQTENGDEETGWILLGLRKRDQAIALATLPAGTLSDTGVAHVRFNSLGQEIGSRIVRKQDRRLKILGVVHTHPGSLRHPSSGDYAGDAVWVSHLRNGEGVFGIGTADVRTHSNGIAIASSPAANVQILGEMCFSWYSLRTGQRNYQPLPVELTLGPDLARPLHAVWPLLEHHAAALDRLFRQQTAVDCRAIENGSVLAVELPLSEQGDQVRVLIDEDETRYFVQRGGEVFQVDPEAGRIDQGIYLLLAELAARSRDSVGTRKGE
jgi:hypothetical protein